MIPILSAYMGHASIRSTAQYLRLTAEVYPELMKHVEENCAYVIPEVANSAVCKQGKAASHQSWCYLYLEEICITGTGLRR